MTTKKKTTIIKINDVEEKEEYNLQCLISKDYQTIKEVKKIINFCELIKNIKIVTLGERQESGGIFSLFLKTERVAKSELKQIRDTLSNCKGIDKNILIDN